MNLIVHRTKEINKKYTSGAIGIYNTGQLFLEEYYTLSIIGHAGLSTNNMDGNTRLCTATAAQALKETFGSDGQPGSYTDIDEADCILHAGHNTSATQAERCETYGHDIETGAARTPEEYEAHDPKGRAILKAAHYSPPSEEPDEKYPFWLTTGRVVYHWHTRPKTGRSQELHDAAPDAFVQISESDAERLGIVEGDMIEVASRRGNVRASARVGGIMMVTSSSRFTTATGTRLTDARAPPTS